MFLTCNIMFMQVVEGVITQDSDVFLYGGNTVFRNFTANQRKATAEKYRYYKRITQILTFRSVS